MQPPKPPPPPPEGIVVAKIKSDTDKQIKAAEIMQRETESRRKAELDKYAIDATSGVEIVSKHLDHGRTVAIEGLKASHAAILDGLNHTLTTADNASNKASEAVDKAHEAVKSHGMSIDHVHQLLSGVLEEVKRHGAIATGKRVLRKNEKGHVEGVDIHDQHGNVIASHTAVKDQSGRIVGLQ